VRSFTVERATRWIAEAEQDVRDAELLLRTDSLYPLCRLASLAASKVLRAVLVELGQRAPAEISLSALCERVAAADPVLAPLAGSLASLEPLAASGTAGPSTQASPSLPLYRREDARAALDLARRAVAEIQGYLAARA